MDDLLTPIADAPAAVVDAPVQQEQLRDAVAAAHQISTHLLAGTAEVTGRLDSYTGHGDRLQLTGKQ